MTVIATDVQRLSNWLKYEYDPSSGVTREVLEYSAVSPTATITGSVLDANGALVVAATLANATYILIDDLTRPQASEYDKVLVLARGYAKVGRDQLIFGNDVTTDIQKDTALAALKLKNIFAVEQI